MHVKKGDNIIVTTGKDKGKKGVIIKSFPKTSQVLIDGVNMKKKHVRARKQGEKGKVVEKASPIHVSNVRLENKKKTEKKEVKKEVKAKAKK